MPYWLSLAMKYIGTKEIPGVKHEPRILSWWKSIRMGGVKDDETPWCAAFVGAMLEQAGVQSTRSARARSYENWGMRLKGPAIGAVAVLWRDNIKSPAGHVGFVVGRDSRGNIMLLGGNQGNEVSIKPFAMYRVLSYHWPLLSDIPANVGFFSLPTLASLDNVSTNEA